MAEGLESMQGCVFCCFFKGSLFLNRQDVKVIVVQGCSQFFFWKKIPSLLGRKAGFLIFSHGFLPFSLGFSAPPCCSSIPKPQRPPG